MGHYKCDHGLVAKICRCPKEHHVSCGEVPDHDTKLAEAMKAEEEAHPLYVATPNGDGSFTKITKVERAYPCHFTFEELNTIEDALTYYKQSAIAEQDNPHWHVHKGISDLLEQVTALRRMAEELEPLSE